MIILGSQTSSLLSTYHMLRSSIVGLWIHFYPLFTVERRTGEMLKRLFEMCKLAPCADNRDTTCNKTSQWLRSLRSICSWFGQCWAGLLRLAVLTRLVAFWSPRSRAYPHQVADALTTQSSHNNNWTRWASEVMLYYIQQQLLSWKETGQETSL